MVISRTCGKSGSDANEAKEETMVDRGSTFIDAFIFVLKDIHIDGWDWWMGAAWNGGIVFLFWQSFCLLSAAENRECPTIRGLWERQESFEFLS